MLGIPNRKQFYEFLIEKYFKNVMHFDQFCQQFNLKCILKVIVPMHP